MAVFPMMPGPAPGSTVPGAMPGGPLGPGPLGASPQGPMSSPMPAPPPGPPGGDPLSALMGAPGPMGGDPASIMQLMTELETTISNLARALPGSEQIAEQMSMLVQAWKTQAVVQMAPAPAQMPGAGSML